MALLLFLLLALLVVSLLGCSGSTPVRAPALVEQPWPEADPEPEAYRLRAYDRVGIKFWGNSELDQDVMIRPDGIISLPFVDEVQAAGLKPSELDAELTKLYEGELARPEITVVVLDVQPMTVHMGGEIGRPGPLELKGPLTLFRAIQEAGGFSPTARRRQVLVIRVVGEGEILARSVDIRPFMSGEDPMVDILLQPKDIIYVPRTKVTNLKAFVEGYIRDLLPLQPFTAVSTISP